GCAGEGWMLVLHTVPGRFTQQGTSISPAQLVRIDGKGQSEVLREVSGTEYFYSKRQKIFIEQPLGKRAMAAASGDRVFLGASDDPRVQVLSSNGKVVGSFDTHFAKRAAVAGDLLEAVTLRIYTEPSEVTREVLRAAIIQTPIRQADLLYDEMVADREGYLWLR